MPGGVPRTKADRLLGLLHGPPAICGLNHACGASESTGLGVARTHHVETSPHWPPKRMHTLRDSLGAQAPGPRTTQREMDRSGQAFPTKIPQPRAGIRDGRIQGKEEGRCPFPAKMTGTPAWFGGQKAQRLPPPGGSCLGEQQRSPGGGGAGLEPLQWPYRSSNPKPFLWPPVPSLSTACSSNPHSAAGSHPPQDPHTCWALCLDAPPSFPSKSPSP